MIVPLADVLERPGRGCLKRVFARGCREGEELSFVVCSRLSEELDRYRFPVDLVWCVRCHRMSARYFRAQGGLNTLGTLLHHYIIVDGTYCPYTLGSSQTAASLSRHTNYVAATDRTLRDVVWLCEYADECAGSERVDEDLTVMGVPQRSLRSGICWYGSMWYTMLLPRRVRRHVLRHTRASDAYLHGLLGDVLRDPEQAERVRAYLYHAYAIGDDPAQDPRLDGQNGYLQLSRLLHALRVPYVTLLRAGAAGGEHRRIGGNVGREHAGGVVVGLRSANSRDAPPLTIDHDGYRLELVSGFIGNEDCGHQTAVARCGKADDWWSLYDPDVVRLKSGPICYRVPGGHTHETHARWWDELQFMTVVSKPGATTKYCDMNPTNRSAREFHRRIDGMAPAPDATRIHIDWIYHAPRRRFGV